MAPKSICIASAPKSKATLYKARAKVPAMSSAPTRNDRISSSGSSHPYSVLSQERATYMLPAPKATARTASSSPVPTQRRSSLAVGNGAYVGHGYGGKARASPSRSNISRQTSRTASSSPLPRQPRALLVGEDGGYIGPGIGGEALDAHSRLSISRQTFSEMLQDDFTLGIQVEETNFAVSNPVEEVLPVEVARFMNIDVLNFAGESVGEFAVDARDTIKQLKDDHLASRCNADAWHLTLLYQEVILQDHLRWTDSVKAATEITVTVMFDPKAILQDHVIQGAVADFFRGGEAKYEVERRYGTISRWDTSQVTTMSSLFRSRQSFNEDLSAWDVGKVKDMSFMFCDAPSFDGDLSMWDVSNVTDTSNMFESARSFNGNLSQWNTARVRYMIEMFHGARRFSSDLSAWNVGNVANMRYMFRETKSFNADLNAWNVSKVTNMNEMFRDAKSFNGDLSAWDFSPDTLMSDMFRGASSFNGDVCAWKNTFRGASSSSRRKPRRLQDA